ncbi:MAG TPA: hypothetical protein VM141_01185 [Planctomycetota bacterium]|nr:hypothetical protein [Planctomycetota bacterium]
MTKTKLVVLLGFCTAFAAGAAAGMTFTRATHRPPHLSYLSRELDLTSRQREQMQQIWSEVLRAPMRPEHEQRQALQREKEEALLELLTPEQKTKRNEIVQEHDRKIAELAAARKRAFDEAVQQTKQMLTEPQREKYEEMLKQRAGGGRRHGRTGMGAPGADAKTPPRSGEPVR